MLRKILIISLVLVIALYVTIIVLSDYKKFLEIISSMKVELIPIIIGLQFVSFFIQSVRQKEFFKKIGIHVTVKKSLMIFMSGLGLLMTPGGSGMAIKMQFLKNEFGHKRRKTIPLVIYERFHDYVAIITIMIIISIVYSTIISWILIVISSTIIGVALLIVKNQDISTIILGKVSKFRLVKRFVPDLNETDTSIKTLVETNTILKGWILSVIAVLLNMVAVYLIIDALGFEMDFVVSTQLFLTSIIAGLLSFIPAGLGVTEASLLGLFVNEGFDFAAASVMVLAIRFLTLWFSTVIGLITLKFVKI